MFVRFYLKSNQNMYGYENVSCFDLDYLKFPSGRNRKCLSLVLENGNTVNFAMSEVSDLVVENHEGERHPYNDNAKFLFVEDGQAYEKR